MTLNEMVQVTLEIWGAIFCLICMGIVFSSRKLSKRTWFTIAKILLSMALMLIFDAESFICIVDRTPEGATIANISVFIVMLMTISFAYYYKEYIRIVIDANGGEFGVKLNRLINLCTLGEILMLVANIHHRWIFYFDEKCNYQVGFGYLPLVSLFLIGLAMLIYAVTVNGKYLDFQTKMLFGVTFFIMLSTSAVQVYITEVSITNIALMVIVLISFGEYEAGIARRVMRRDLELAQKKAEIAEKTAEAAEAKAEAAEAAAEAAKARTEAAEATLEAAQAETEAAEYRARMITSQIQPHFMFNSLNAIKALAMIDPNECIKAVDYLSRFLRGSLDAINSSEPITIAKEFENTNAYLSMQKYRFGSSLTVEMEDTSEGFLVPPFTIQPLVENAVHAIRAKEDGKGSIKVKAYSIKDECHKILVEDTGTGFDPAKVGSDGRGHYGMAIVRERIEKMSGGTMEIHSVIGEGTTMEITIPWKVSKGEDK